MYKRQEKQVAIIYAAVKKHLLDLPVDQILDFQKDVYKRQVFVVNGPHASLAFLGYYKGLKTIPEAENDSEISEIVGEIVKELTAAIMKEYPITEKELHLSLIHIL